jgi:hypothetical protein
MFNKKERMNIRILFLNRALLLPEIWTQSLFYGSSSLFYGRFRFSTSENVSKADTNIAHNSVAMANKI